MGTNIPDQPTIPPMPCKFCNGNPEMDGRIIKLYNSGHGWDLYFEPDDSWYATHIRIYYCPMCGKKLDK